MLCELNESVQSATHAANLELQAAAASDNATSRLLGLRDQGQHDITCIPTHMKMRNGVWLAYGLIAIFSVYLSLKIVMGGLGFDPDSLFSITLWQGVHAGGWRWVERFLFSPDNWLLSIVSFNFLSFALFGPRPDMVVFSGWLAFCLAACVSGCLALELKARRAALLLPILLLLVGRFAHQAGLVGHPASHNITNLYGLTALLCLLKWVKDQKIIYVGLILLLLAVGSISDPWMVAAYYLPTLGLCGMLLLRPPTAIPRRESLKLLLALSVVFLMLGTHVFGVFNFLPQLPLRFANNRPVIANNALFLVKDFGLLLNIVPWETANYLSMALLSLASFLAVLYVGFSGGHLSKLFDDWLFQSKLFDDWLFPLFLAFAVFSTAAMIVAFVFINTWATGDSARFLLNVLYLWAISAGVAADLSWQRLAIPQKLLLVGFVSAFVASGLASTFPIWGQPGFTVRDHGSGSLITFLKANDLSYGYGPYWGANANAITAMTGGHITIRPVIFDKTTGMITSQLHAQSSPNWYSKEDYSPAQRSFFVIVESDGEECADPSLCLRGLEAQFGPPSWTLVYGPSATILVWTHPLLLPFLNFSSACFAKKHR